MTEETVSKYKWVPSALIAAEGAYFFYEGNYFGGIIAEVVAVLVYFYISHTLKESEE